MNRTTKLMSAIIVVSVLLLCCIAVDYADDSISNINESSMPENLPEDTIILDTNDSTTANSSLSTIKVKSSDLVHIKPKYPTITITARPSCNCKYSYRWHTTTFVNYCPHCYKYGTLYNKHKWGARHEQELTCRYDDCDYCGVCGKEKYSWSHYYLRRA